MGSSSTGVVRNAPDLLLRRLKTQIPTGQSYLIKEESDAVLKGIFEAARPRFEREYAELEREFSVEVADSILQCMMGEVAQRVLQPLKNKLPEMPPFMQQIMGSFFKFTEAGRMPNFEEMEEMGPMIEQCEREYLAHQQAKTGIVAESIEELVNAESCQRCRRFLEDLTGDLSVERLFEDLLREGMCSSFFRVVEEDVEAYFREQRRGDALELFDKMIEDYVSGQPCKYWRMTPELNYGYNICALDDRRISLEDKFFLAKRITKASRVLSSMEFVLDGFEKMGPYRDQLRENLPWILFGDPKWVRSFFLLEGVTLRKTDYQVYCAASGFVKAVLHQVKLGCDRKTRELLRTASDMVEVHIDLMLCLSLLPQSKDMILSPEQQTLLTQIVKLFDQSFEDTLNKAKILRDARNEEDKQKRLPILGIGFAGSRFEPHPDHTHDRVILNFTSDFRSDGKHVAGHPILYGIQTLLTPVTERRPKFKIEIPDVSQAANPEILKYITYKVLDLLKSSSGDFHADVKSSFQRALTDRLDAEIKVLQQQKGGKKMKTASAQEVADFQQRIEAVSALREVIHDGNFSALTDEQIAHLRRRIDEGEQRVCVETVISQSSGNAYTLSFAMGRVATDAVQFKDAPYAFGTRGLVQPCLTRCQMMGVAHTLWGDLQHVPNLQQAHDRSLDRGGEGVNTIDPAVLQHLVARRLEELIALFPGSSSDNEDLLDAAAQEGADGGVLGGEGGFEGVGGALV